MKINLNVEYDTIADAAARKQPDLPPSLNPLDRAAEDVFGGARDRDRREARLRAYEQLGDQLFDMFLKWSEVERAALGLPSRAEESEESDEEDPGDFPGGGRGADE